MSCCSSRHHSIVWACAGTIVSAPLGKKYLLTADHCFIGETFPLLPASLPLCSRQGHSGPLASHARRVWLSVPAAAPLERLMHC